MENVENIIFITLYLLYTIPVIGNVAYAIYKNDKELMAEAFQLLLGAVVFPFAILASVAFIVFGTWAALLWILTEFIPNHLSRNEVSS